ncbi:MULTISPECIES: collagenase [unclassified Streptomyces]|uniref:collagenase n=1 Tax=unclassified Streptomyces TaxID=2593676 RepID=UPI0023652F34|nr:MULTISPECIES: collagenase [unclassified Streptomyces]MDF3148916.1 collagenase [Streptomyces sp. T21Q-yed]WDF43778.1 collagenase [Streptomyces sp. T12]
MRYRFVLPRRMAGTLAVCATLSGLLSTPALAAPPADTGPTAPVTSPRKATQPPPPTGARVSPAARPAVQKQPLTPAQLPPLAPTSVPTPPRTGAAAKAASCSPDDFGRRTGAELVAFVKASTTDCVNSLFAVTGSDARAIFREPQMVTVAKAFTSTARIYRGDNSARVWQLVLFLRAGYYVQFNHPADVGPYGAPLARNTTSGLDTFFARPRSRDVTAANGDVLGEVVVLTDSADQQARYLKVYRRMLNAYDSSYNAIRSMLAAVNAVYTPLWRGNWNADYVKAVTADPSIARTLHAFALNHLDLLATDNAYLASNAGMNLARYVEHPALHPTVRPLTKGLLDASRITGPTAGLWVAVATQAEYYDGPNCSYYGVCDLAGQLTRAVLPIAHSCDATHTIRAQALTAADLGAACASVLGQDRYFHDLVRDDGPIPGQYLSTLDLVVFAGSADYRTYAGAIFGISTDNGGMTLIGDPSDPANEPFAVMYQKPRDDGHAARIWNLNHEYTHYLDARYNMKGDFAEQTSVPDVWWIEGVAEYVSYGYRRITDEQAVAEAGKHTYRLSTLFQNTYSNSDVTRTYPWGYLAVRYMFERHPADIHRMLARFRVGDYAGGHAVYASDIGTRYDADFDAWLTACAAGACATPTAAVS